MLCSPAELSNSAEVVSGEPLLVDLDKGPQCKRSPQVLGAREDSSSSVEPRGAQTCARFPHQPRNQKHIQRTGVAEEDNTEIGAVHETSEDALARTAVVVECRTEM